MWNIDELQVMNLLKELFIWKVCSHTPMLVNSTYWVISPPPPPHFFPLQIHYKDHWSRDSWKTTITNYFVELRIFFFLKNKHTHTQGRGKGVLTQRHITTLLKSWNWEFYYYFYGIKHCTGKLFLRILIFGGIRALTIVMRF